MLGLKRRLADGFDVTGLNRALLALQARALGPYVRAVNYHDVPPSFARAFEAQLREYRERFEPVGPDELRALIQGRWRHRRPGILLSFDDGLRSHADVVAPLLERHGLPGWFMVPVDFVAAHPGEQRTFAREHHIQADVSVWDDGRIAMTWDDVRRLDRDHVIVCHTRSHRRLVASLSDQELELEIVGAKQRLERELGHAVEGFAWVGGEEASYSARAARIIRAAGFTWCFMTNNAPILSSTDPHQLQRSNVEASFSPALVRFTISGFYDLLYLPKRRRVNRLTAASAD
jgi:peptidoglycan/xylan/chitin deacetylase (PgdA/CDA1 family)